MATISLSTYRVRYAAELANNNNEQLIKNAVEKRPDDSIPCGLASRRETIAEIVFLSQVMDCNINLEVHEYRCIKDYL